MHVSLGLREGRNKRTFRVRIGLNKPKRVRLHSVLVTRHLLLLVPPLRQLDLVGEQITPLQRMLQPKQRPQRSHPLPTLLVPLIALINLHNPIIIGVPNEVLQPVARHLVLEIHIRHWRAEIVRVQVPLGRDVPKPNARSTRQIREIPVLPVEPWVSLRSRVEDRPVVVMIPMRVQRDLLLLASGGIVVRVRVEVAALRVIMPDRHLRPDSDIRKGIGHTAASERVLELGRHEAVAVARIAEDGKVDAEHGHVDEERDRDEADSTRDKVAHPDPRGDPEVAE